jgi:hypothetical protein
VTGVKTLFDHYRLFVTGHGPSNFRHVPYYCAYGERSSKHRKLTTRNFVPRAISGRREPQRASSRMPKIAVSASKGGLIFSDRRNQQRDSDLPLCHPLATEASFIRIQSRCACLQATISKCDDLLVKYCSAIPSLS